MPKLKLSPEQVADIKAHIRMARRLAKKAGRKILPNGMADRLAAKHGVSRRTIEHLITGDRWSNRKWTARNVTTK
jgi:hypothetical protein